MITNVNVEAKEMDPVKICMKKIQYYAVRLFNE